MYVVVIRVAAERENFGAYKHAPARNFVKGIFLIGGVILSSFKWGSFNF